MAALLGGKPETAVKYDVFAALYNDADFGIDDAGISRLPALDARGIAGATVQRVQRAHRRRALDLRDGFITAVNATRRALRRRNRQFPHSNWWRAWSRHA